MVPIPGEFPKEYHYNFWNNEPPDSVHLTCIMPNGVVIILEVTYHATLCEIKEDLWDEAPKFPLYGKLHDMSVYIFTHINNMAELEELHDETKRISDIRPTGACLMLTEDTRTLDRSFNTNVSHLIGKRLQEFDALNSAEVNDFRFKMRKMGEEIAQHRLTLSWQDKLFYYFPPRMEENSYILSNSLAKNTKIAMKLYNYNEHDKEVVQSSITLSIGPTTKPKELLHMILEKRKKFKLDNIFIDDYVLKVCGQDEYIVGDNSIIQFQYIQDCLSKNVIPNLVTVYKDGIGMPINSDHYELLDFSDIKKPKTSYSTLTLRKKGKHEMSWNITDHFAITLCNISKLNYDTKKSTEVGIQVGLFYGGKSLCQPLKTSDIAINENELSSECQFNTKLEFDIQVCNIPRNAKLCFVVYEVSKYVKGSKTKKSKESKDSSCNPIAWANTSVYDFKSQLRTGACTLYMWTFAEDMMSDDVLHPLGTVVSNPDTKCSTSLTLIFDRYGKEQSIIYPCIDTLMNYCKKNNKTADLSEIEQDETVIQNYHKILQDADNVEEIYDQDREKLWQLKYHWLKHEPQFLPKLLNCIDWDKKEQVAEAVELLYAWPRLPVEKSLELLDYAYANQEVRSFAVKCLMELSDQDLSLYLLQLVQAIKHELFLECDLVKFLIKRALNNQKIGHYLFWHLRSEMQVPSVSVRFGLILEAYFRGSREHMPILLKQLECLDRFKKCSENVRLRRDKEKGKAALRAFLEENNSVEHNIRNPLDPTYRCKGIKLEKCKIMDSKMKPLWIVFENHDFHGEDIYLIFKNGDDLRQDMLTLQMLRIMDQLWKREGLDLRMNPYNCISMEHRVGMIEVVLNAETIANIQKEKGMFSATSAFRKTHILAWLKDHNTTDDDLSKAINEFTLSCAGYCVATYVLGIADRHSDNIMVKKSGQMFHIDFGHILGHFKEKFGFKRERVPFVLTHDFVYVINKGQKTASEFKVFQYYCEKAFMILRKHGSLIMSLCAMMISTGLPELSSEKDLNYLRETLVLNKTDDEALNHFRAKFDEALSNSWKTSLNWASHNIAKNNKA